MQLVRLFVLAAAGFAAVAGYIVESRRLGKIRELRGEQARDLYEAMRARSDWTMWAVAAVLAVAAVVITLDERIFTSGVAGLGGR